MKKKFRVKKNHEFQAILGNRDRYADYFFIIYKKANNLQIPRIGISVGKKLGNAVARNKYKRQIRMILQQNMNKIDPKYDYIIIVKTTVEKLSYKDIEKNLEKSLKKAKIVYDTN